MAFFETHSPWALRKRTGWMRIEGQKVLAKSLGPSRRVARTGSGAQLDIVAFKGGSYDQTPVPVSMNGVEARKFVVIPDKLKRGKGLPHWITGGESLEKKKRRRA